MKYSLFIGRWQPFHDGHKKLIQKVKDEGKGICIAIRDTPLSEDNPYSVSERRKMIPLFYPAIHKKEWLDALDKVFDTKYIAQAEQVDLFEKEFGEKFGYKYPISVNAGTNALELAYHSLGLKPGDEVIGPVISCIATYLPLLRMGVRVRLVDVEKDTMTMDAEDLEAKINQMTKAIVPVNLGGMFCNEKVYRISEDYGIPTVVDACQTVGKKNNHKARFITYSFQAIKHFTTADGGMLVCDNKNDYDRVKKLRWFGIDREARRKKGYKAYEGRQMTMDVREPGYKYHMNDIAAAMGRVGLKHSDDMMEHRKKIAKIYDQINLPHIRGGTYWLYMILPENREKVAEHLRKKGVETNLVHVRNDAYTCMGGRINAPNMDWLEKRYLYIPIHQNISPEDAKYVRDCVNEVIL